MGVHSDGEVYYERYIQLHPRQALVSDSHIAIGLMQPSEHAIDDPR